MTTKTTAEIWHDVAVAPEFHTGTKPADMPVHTICAAFANR